MFAFPCHALHDISLAMPFYVSNYPLQVHGQAPYRSVHHTHTSRCGCWSTKKLWGCYVWQAQGEIPPHRLHLRATCKQTVFAQSRKFCNAYLINNFKYPVIKNKIICNFSNIFQIIDNNTAVRFLHSVGHSVSKQTVLESELMVLKGLEFSLDAPNPLTYVEILLEVLGKISYLNTEQLTWSGQN